MQTFFYQLLLIGFCDLILAQEQEGIEASSCVLFPPNTLIKSNNWWNQLISMKTDQENWTTDIFLRRKDDSRGYHSTPNSCLRVAASGNQIKILGFHNSICGINEPFYTHEWYFNDDEVIHLLIQGFYSSSLSLRLLGYETQAASIPIDVRLFMTLNSSTKVEFFCHKGCPLEYGYNNKDITVTNKPIVIYGLQSPLNLTMNLMTSQDGIKESRNIDLPLMKNHTLYQVEVKEAENEVMITINGEGKLYQVAEEKMFSLEKTILKIQGRGWFLYTEPDCIFKDQENEDNKNGDGDDGISADEGDGDGVIVAATTAADEDNDDGDDTTSADDGDDKEKPRQNHKITIDMSLNMNVTLTLV